MTTPNQPNQQNNRIQQDINRPNDAVPYMNTLTQLTNKLVKDGYLDTYKVTTRGLFSNREEKYFTPEEVSVINFYRFEGQSDPADNTILYQIETAHGGKGLLIDAYGAYSDANVNAFMQSVEDISKKTEKRDHRFDA